MGKTIRLISYLRMAVGTGSAFVFFGAGGLCLNFVILLVELIPAEFTEKREHMIQRMVHFTFRAFYRYLKVFRLIDGKAKGQEKLPSSAYIFVANHPTLLDIVMILATLPKAVCVVKPEIMDSVYMRGVARTAGYISNEDGEQLIAACVEKLKQGPPVVIFPEGTRSLANGLADFKRSAAWVALKSGFPVVPAVLSISAPILMKDWKWYQVPPHSIEMLLEIHAPIFVEHVLENPKSDPVSARIFTTFLQKYFENKVIFNDNNRK
jgi:1-acyl-sn-glycerol-3-phosphate acyltransferase